MTAQRLAWLLAVVGMALGAWWVSVSTEWVEEDSPRPARGEARDNPVYAFEQLLRKLGMTVAHHETLDALPPPGARLVMLSGDWQLMPERAEQLHQWVRRGGHLVLTRDADWKDSALAAWVPVRDFGLKRPEGAKPRPPAVAASGVLLKRAPVVERRIPLASTPPLWEGVERLAVCDWFPEYQTLQARQGHDEAWTLKLVEPTQTTQALRVPLGQGSVTVLNVSGRVFNNPTVLGCGFPPLLAAVVQAEPGATAWIYLHEKREPLLTWLWQQGWIAIAIFGLALAAALWRAAVRFGPRLAPAPRLRRSISEQVRGLGAYLHRSGHEALLVAQQRALNEIATRTLPRYARLPLAERARAIAEATGLPHDELSTALSMRFCTRAQLPQHLQVLEAARRRLHRTPDERPAP
ncbi:DUF4350 domain-containing protein [Roseateles asaccharophilus]|uniref:DUF4350 domain-containing protein n=1 Tax=Roseateles asaccharophilus TaxID=582607 RepID=A0ABU2AEQ9_9BURK|nr:DUF4350 domain-containing protein [Roseateles asaccharophilus]MDR7335700.1 hypothetical protein [Roseateles asaccharophilus]